WSRPRQAQLLDFSVPNDHADCRDHLDDQKGCAAGTNFTGTSVTKVLSQRVHSSIPACSEGMWPRTIRAWFFFSLTASAVYSTVSHSRDSPVISNWMSGFSSAPISRGMPAAPGA